jgi:hypothetical protein
MTDLLDRLAQLPPEQLGTYAAGLGAVGYSAWRLAQTLCHGTARLARWATAPKPVSPLCQAILTALETPGAVMVKPNIVHAGGVNVHVCGSGFAETDNTLYLINLGEGLEDLSDLLSLYERDRVLARAVRLARRLGAASNAERVNRALARIPVQQQPS